MRRRTLLAELTAGVVGLAGCQGMAPQARQSSDWPSWPTNRTAAPIFEPHPDVETPALVAADVTDRPGMTDVTDPFVAVADDRYHLFFEVISETGEDIGHAVSEDGLDWEYTSIVLDTSGHLAYPYVRRLEDEWYMFPDRVIRNQRHARVPSDQLSRCVDSGDPRPRPR